jgi:hypothetical protein
MGARGRKSKPTPSRWNPSKFCDEQPEACVGEKYRFAVYGKHETPEAVRRELTKPTGRLTPQQKQRETICRGSSMTSTFVSNALRAADQVVVGYHEDQVVAVILVLFPSFISPLTNKPVCQDHEVYMDVVCSYYCYRRCGAETIRRFMKYCTGQGIRALRIFATQQSMQTWQTNWGFRECETILQRGGKCVYGPYSKKSYPGETDEDRTYRMTLILNPEERKTRSRAKGLRLSLYKKKRHYGRSPKR